MHDNALEEFVDYLNKNKDKYLSEDTNSSDCIARYIIMKSNFEIIDFNYLALYN